VGRPQNPLIDNSPPHQETPEAAAPEAEAPAGEMDSVATRTSDLEVCLGSRERAARDWFDAV
jgi:hypothetical protein